LSAGFFAEAHSTETGLVLPTPPPGGEVEPTNEDKPEEGGEGEAEEGEVEVEEGGNP
jgi:hypothetical protein